MGIHGLLPLLVQQPNPNSASEHLSQFANCTLGIDGHGWLHKAIYGCATALALNQPTTAYLVYFARRLRLLQSLNITPLVVLDGAPPPLKSDTNADRRQRRDAALSLGRQLLTAGKVAAAERAFQSAVGITRTIVQQLVSLLKYMKIQYIIAPYEADPQLVYLERIGRIDAILSEDSDLLVFGAQTLVTKWDAQLGTCQVIRARSVFGASGPLRGWTRNMLVDCAILAGCDYLASAPGVGIKTAMRAVEGVVNADKFEAGRCARKPSSHTVIPDDVDNKINSDNGSIPNPNSNPIPYRADTLSRAIRRLQFQSNKPSSSSTSVASSASHVSHLTSPAYLQSAIRARLAFRHARVWCPFTRRLACLRPWPPAHERSSPGSDYAHLGLMDVEETDYDGIGPWKPPEVAEKVAIGDVDPVTLQPCKHVQDSLHVWEAIVRVVEQRPLSSGGPTVSSSGSGDEISSNGEGFEEEDELHVFVEFEGSESDAAAGTAHDESETVIPASDDSPRRPAPPRSQASHGSTVPVHLPSPPTSDPSSSGDSATSYPDSIPASPTLPPHSPFSSQQPRHVPPPDLAQPAASTTPSYPPSLQHHVHRHHLPVASNLQSISAMRQLPTRPPPFPNQSSPSRKSAPAATASDATRPLKQQYQPSLAAFMARKSSANAHPHGKENHTHGADPTFASSSKPSAAHRASKPPTDCKKRAWPTAAAMDRLPPVPRVSGLFQAPRRPTQAQMQVSALPPVKRARNTR